MGSNGSAYQRKKKRKEKLERENSKLNCSVRGGKKKLANWADRRGRKVKKKTCRFPMRPLWEEGNCTGSPGILP